MEEGFSHTRRTIGTRKRSPLEGGSRGVSSTGGIAAGGHLPEDVADRLDKIEPFPTLIVHGHEDESVDVEKAQEGEARLQAHGYEVDVQFFEGGHDLPAEELEKILEWMEKRIGINEA